MQPSIVRFALFAGRLVNRTTVYLASTFTISHPAARAYERRLRV